MTTQPLSALTMLLSRHTKRREFITLRGGAAASRWRASAAADDAGDGVLQPRVIRSICYSASGAPHRHLMVASCVLRHCQQLLLGWRMTRCRLVRRGEFRTKHN